jgi:hypothetical protein
MQCAQCQQTNRDAARFCAACASPFGPTCVACGTQNPSGASFCDHCATPLTVDTTAAHPPPPGRPGGWAEVRLHALLPMVIGLLQSDSRVTYRALTDVLGFDQALLAKIREELTFRQLARDEDGKGLVWTGEVQPAASPAVAMPRQPARPDVPTVRAAAVSPLPPSHGPAVLTPHEAPTTPSASRLPPWTAV